MSVEINPHSQLGFSRPLTQVAKKSMFLTNSNSEPVAFKVKTTAPKQYCVRPNSGRIEPGERVEVQVLLQPMKEEPPASAKCRDKFLVQSSVITPDKELLPMTEFWAVQERQKDGVFEHKLRCVFLPPSSATVPEEYEGDDSRQGLAAAGIAGAGGAGIGAGAGAAYGASQSQGMRGSDMSRSVAQPPLTTSYAASPAQPIVAGSANSPQELQAEVQRLRAQLNSRNTQLDTKKSGVPVHIVVAIAIAVFAVTYLFF